MKEDFQSPSFVYPIFLSLENLVQPSYIRLSCLKIY